LRRPLSPSCSHARIREVASLTLADDSRTGCYEAARSDGLNVRQVREHIIKRDARSDHSDGNREAAETLPEVTCTLSRFDPADVHAAADCQNTGAKTMRSCRTGVRVATCLARPERVRR